MSDGLRSHRHPICPFSCLTQQFVSVCPQCLVRIAFHLRRKCFWNKRCFDTLSDIKTVSALSHLTVPPPQAVMPTALSSLAIPHPGRNAILCSHPQLVFYRSAAWNHKPDPSWLGPHPVRLHGSWKKTEISSCFYFILKKVKGTREHLETARGKKNPKNELLKRDWKVGYQIAQTLLTYCSLQRCCYQNFSLYSESKDLSCRAQKLLSETAGWITTPLLHTYATKQDVRTLQNSKIFSGNIPD